MVFKKLEITDIGILSNLGKEGEYAIVFNAKNWSENNKQEFLDGLKKINWINQDQTNFGGVNILRNKKLLLEETQSNFKTLVYSEFIQLGS